MLVLFLQYKPRDWLGSFVPILPTGILCQAVRRTLTIQVCIS